MARILKNMVVMNHFPTINLLISSYSEQLVKSEQAKGTIPPLTATMLGLYKQERSGATGGISTESWIQMYPAALDPKINYLEGTGTGGRVKKSEATQKVKDDIAKWKAKNVCFNDMFNIVLEETLKISSSSENGK